MLSIVATSWTSSFSWLLPPGLWYSTTRSPVPALTCHQSWPRSARCPSLSLFQKRLSIQAVNNLPCSWWHPWHRPQLLRPPFDLDFVLSLILSFLLCTSPHIHHNQSVLWYYGFTWYCLTVNNIFQVYCVSGTTKAGTRDERLVDGFSRHLFACPKTTL